MLPLFHLGALYYDHDVLLCQHMEVRLPGKVRWDDSALHHDSFVLAGTPARVWRFTHQGHAVLKAITEQQFIPEGESEQELIRRLLDSGAVHPVFPAGVGTPRELPPGFQGFGVVIPVRDDVEGLKKTLHALTSLQAATQVQFPMVVVDDGSTQAAAIEQCVVTTPHAELIRHELPQGPGAARNTGWKSLVSEWVVFLDADMEIQATDLIRLMQVAEISGVGILGPRIRQAPHAGIFAEAVAATSSLDLGPQESVVRIGAAVAHMPAACLLVSRATLEAVDGFDESFHAGEDVDFIWRSDQAGIIARYVPAVSATHGPRAAFGALRRRFVYGSSTAPLGKRHGVAVAPVRISAATGGGVGAFLLRRPVIGSALLAWSLWRRRQRMNEVPALRAWAIPLAIRLTTQEISQLADAACRPYLPVSLFGLAWRRTRPVVGLMMLGSLIRRTKRIQSGTPVRQVLWQLLDDGAYSAGVWRSALQERSPYGLMPQGSNVSNTPGKN